MEKMDIIIALLSIIVTISFATFLVACDISKEIFRVKSIVKENKDNKINK